MSINLITSYIIGGMILLTLGWMNYSVGQNTTEVVLSQNKQANRLDISEVIAYDFPKIGYKAGGGLDTLILEARSNTIEFYSNIDNSTDGSIEKVRWEFTDIAVTVTKNPNDDKLIRTVNGVESSINLGVSSFKLRYFESHGNEIPMSFPISDADLKLIGQIEVELVLQSAEHLFANRRSNGNYVKSAWVKRFTPRNLTLNI